MYRCCTQPYHVRAYIVLKGFPEKFFEARYCRNCEDLLEDEYRFGRAWLLRMVAPFLWNGHTHVTNQELFSEEFRAAPGKAGQFV